MQEYELESPRRPVRIAIAAAEFNRFITDQLLEGASQALEAHGVAPDDLILAWEDDPQTDVITLYRSDCAGTAPRSRTAPRATCAG